MRYVLRRQVMGSQTVVEISRSEFETAIRSRNTLIQALAIEERYDAVVQNYVDFETEVARLAIESMIRHMHSYVYFFDVRSKLNVRTVNLLTTVRSYIDQLPQILKSCLGENSDANSRIKSKFSDHYDSSFEYRLMEALRNHVQHCGTAVHSTPIGGRWTSLDERGRLEHKIGVLTRKEFLEENSEFKKQVLSEMPEEVDILHATRTYLTAISAVNEHARQIVDELVATARSFLESLHQRSIRADGPDTVGLVVEELDDDSIVRAIPILLDWDDVRVQLQRRNRVLLNLAKRHITGQPWSMSET